MSTDDQRRSLAEPGRVVSLCLWRTGDELQLRISLLPLGSDGPVNLCFEGVRDVHFRSDRTDLTGIVLLLAEDIGGRGWEGLRYRVTDSEEELISFYCRETKTIDQ